MTFNSADEARRHYERRYLRFGLALTADLGIVLALPAVAGAWLGSRLDDRYGSRPLWLIICLLMAAGLSAFIIYRRSRRFSERYQRLIDEERQAVERFEPTGNDQ